MSGPFECSGEAAAHDAGAFDMCACADCQRHFPGGSLRCYPHGNICDDCHENRQDKGIVAESFRTSPRQPRAERWATGAFRTFYNFRTGLTRLSTAEAHRIVRGWCLEKPSPYRPNPLCLATRKHLTAYYDRAGANTGD